MDLNRFQNPDVLELERSAPKPQAATINLLANAFACLGMEAYQGDVKSAFAQSKKIDRESYVSQPADGIPGLKPDQLLQLRTEIYGTVRGPAWWGETLVEQIKKLGYKESQFENIKHMFHSLIHKILVSKTRRPAI